jgi:hypothetical protein
MKQFWQVFAIARTEFRFGLRRWPVSARRRSG